MPRRRVTMLQRVAGFARGTLTLIRKAVPVSLSGVSNRGGWWPIIRESFAGAWQSNVTVDTTTVLAFSALYRCVVLIADDIAKLRIKLVEQDRNGIWMETSSPSFSPVLRKPNHYQTRIQFVQSWMTSKLTHGNTYVLKVRDQRRVVVAMHVLDPTKCAPLVAPNGDVYYRLNRDDLSGLNPEGGQQVVVPASEVIHDRHCPLYHPLMGVSPIYACGLAALQGLRIQENSTLFFQNGSMPGGVLTAPGTIPQATADRLKTDWEEKFSGANIGRVAILGDGLKYEAMRVTAVDAQLIEQLKWTAENVCSAFGVPPYMVGVGPPPNYNNIQALNVQYYSQCIQVHVESMELLLDEGLGLVRADSAKLLGTEFDIDALLRMDSATLTKVAGDSIGAGGMSVNEARERFYGLGPVKGGETPYLQQQYFSLEALAERDQNQPFAKPAAPVAALPAPADEPDSPTKAWPTHAAQMGMVEEFRGMLA